MTLPLPSIARRMAFLLLAGLSLAGCRLEDITPQQIGMIASSVQTIGKAARPVADEEEYYIGRAVAAQLTATYPLYRNKRLTEYLNLVGQTLALHTEQPTTFGGYHFAVLDTPEINAFACPGGTVLITRGMVASVKNEDELAAVLAHELGHVIHRDGIAAIQSSRWSQALLIIGSQAAREFSSKDTAQLVSLFQGSIDDVVKTLVVNGYGRDQEKKADRAALGYLAAAGYDPQGLVGYLDRLQEAGRGSKGGILATHPGTDERLENVREAGVPSADRSGFPRRSKRFAEMVP
ncbi:M48 family metalloprotease [Oryzomonas japonica]|uniref:M48 family metalloprotease n=1 Tax=Oryzomonas japonica TaxID=2603858 RepID=A0A7J4ZQI5_9BACT|nr:M48 family metalloprotease [Oryzomonas japonica]KAB0665362.1 M48 family metalloprotease [Oryzomonas japonica]